MSLETDPRKSLILTRARQFVNAQIAISGRATFSRHDTVDLLSFLSLPTGTAPSGPTLAYWDARLKAYIINQRAEDLTLTLYADPTKTYEDWVDPSTDTSGYVRPAILNSGPLWYILPSGGTTGQYIDGTGALHTFPALFSGAYSDLTGRPTLGTAAAQNSTAFDAAGLAAAAQAASQPLDSDLTAIAALATAPFGRSLLTTADAAAVRTAIGAGIGSVTSVGLTVPTGLSVTGSPVTGSGTLAITTSLSGIIQGSGGALSVIAVGSGLSFSAGTLNTVNSGTVTSVGVSSSDITVGSTPVTSSGTITLTLPNIVSAGTYSTVTVNTKGQVTAGTGWTINNSPGRALVSVAAAANGFQLSTTRGAAVHYSVTIASAVQIGLVTTVSGTVVLETALTNSATASDWTAIARITNGQTIGLAIALSLTQTNAMELCGFIPAGSYCRIRTISTSGTPTFTLNEQHEVLM